MAKIRKALSYLFDTDNPDIQNFEDIYEDINHNFEDRMANGREIFTYSNKLTFSKNAVTTITVNAKNISALGTYVSPQLLGLLGFSLGNQTIQVVSIELLPEQNDEDGVIHDEVRVQLYNPSSADIVTDFKIQYYWNPQLYY